MSESATKLCVSIFTTSCMLWRVIVKEKVHLLVYKVKHTHRISLFWGFEELVSLPPYMYLPLYQKVVISLNCMKILDINSWLINNVLSSTIIMCNLKWILVCMHTKISIGIDLLWKFVHGCASYMPEKSSKDTLSKHVNISTTTNLWLLE